MSVDSQFAIKTQTFYPNDGGDLLKIMCQAKENSLRVKHFGGAYPISSEGSEVLLSLSRMKRIVWYDPDQRTITVEGGITLSELLKRMEYINYTIELYGTIPDMTLLDAISVGLIGSSGTIARCLKTCHVLQSDGLLLEWQWPDSDTKLDAEHSLSEDPRVTGPNLNTLVCGLGVVGIVTAATLHCVPMHFAQEVTYECSVSDIFENLHKVFEGLYTRLTWYPLLYKAIITKNYSVRIHQSYHQPWWVEWQEKFFHQIHWVVHQLSPFISWYFPSFAAILSKAQSDLMLRAYSFRNHFCFRPQVVVSVNTYCRGLKWALPVDSLRSAMKEIEEWSEFNPHLCSTPIVISLQTHQSTEIHQPYLCPYTERKSCTIWTDWFNNKSISKTFSVGMAEFEAILQKNGGRKCWSVGPVFASPLIAQMYPGYRLWARNRTVLDPSNMFRSAYVEGELFIDKY